MGVSAPIVTTLIGLKSDRNGTLAKEKQLVADEKKQGGGGLVPPRPTPQQQVKIFLQRVEKKEEAGKKR